MAMKRGLGRGLDVMIPDNNGSTKQSVSKSSKRQYPLTMKKCRASFFTQRRDKSKNL